MVQEESQKPIERIMGIRKQKNYYPRDFVGESSEIANLGQVDLNKGKWLILSRTISRLMKVDEELRKKNLFFETNKGKSLKVSLYKAAMNYELWTKGKILEDKVIKDINEYIENPQWDHMTGWYEAFTLADEKEKLYIKKLKIYPKLLRIYYLLERLLLALMGEWSLVKEHWETDPYLPILELKISKIK